MKWIRFPSLCSSPCETFPSSVFLCRRKFLGFGLSFGCFLFRDENFDTFAIVSTRFRYARVDGQWNHHYTGLETHFKSFIHHFQGKISDLDLKLTLFSSLKTFWLLLRHLKHFQLEIFIFLQTITPSCSLLSLQSPLHLIQFEVKNIFLISVEHFLFCDCSRRVTKPK